MDLSKKIIPLLVLIILLYIPFFSHLGSQPLRLWDESRQAFNAYEMMNSGNIIVTTFENKPDMWNLKPPMLIWCQSTLMRIFGPWELAVRLPSAICGFLTAIMLLFFAWKYYNRFWLGFIAALVLCTARGYIDEHGVRSGEYDSMVTFFSTFYMLCFLLFYEKGKTKYLYAGMIGITCAVLTKGIAGLFFTPAIFIAAFAFKRVRFILTNKHFYFSILIFVFFACGYYVLRNFYNPGYFQAVIDNELGGRFLETVEGHNADFWFYYELLHKFQMHYWALLILCGFFAGIFDANSGFRRLIWYISGIVLSFWIIISISQTKISWYLYQAIPALAFLVATFLFYVFTIIEKIETPNLLRYKILPYVFILIVAFTPYNEIFKRTYLAPEYDWDKRFYSIGYYLRDFAKGKKTMDEPVKIVFEIINPHLKYYSNIINSKQKKVEFISKEEIKKGDLIVCSEEHIRNYLIDHFIMDQIEDKNSLYIYKIKDFINKN